MPLGIYLHAPLSLEDKMPEFTQDDVIRAAAAAACEMFRKRRDGSVYTSA